MLPSIDGKWGSEEPNGEWNGIMGMILRGEVEFGMTNFFVTQNRAVAVDFGKAFLVTPNQMYIRFPEQSAGWMTFLNPLSMWMWISTLLALLISALTLSCIYYVQRRHGFTEATEFSFGNTIMLAIYAITQHGTDHEPRYHATRIVFILLYFIGLLIYSAYSAALTSFLAVNIMSFPFNSLETLYYDTDFRIGTFAGTAFEENFSNGNDIRRKIYEERWEVIKNLEDGMTRIKNERLAFIWATEVVNEYIADSCDYVAIEGSIFDGITAYIVKKDYPYTKLLDFYLSKMLESGQILRMWNSWKPEVRSDCFSSSEQTSLGFENVLSAFALLGVSIGLALVIMIFEILVRVVMRQRELRKSKLYKKSISDTVVTRVLDSDTDSTHSVLK